MRVCIKKKANGRVDVSLYTGMNGIVTEKSQEKNDTARKGVPELDDSRSELGRRKSRRMKDGEKAWTISNKVHIIHLLVLNKRYPHCIAFPLLLHFCEPSGKRPSLKMAIISSSKHSVKCSHKKNVSSTHVPSSSSSQ